jgi:hypothetical protein
MHSIAKTRSGTAAAFLCSVLILSGCGTTTGDRAVSGGLLGAGTGALIGSVAGSAGKGALIGGLGGMALGALTSPRQVNFGEPIWRHSSSSHRHRYASGTTRDSGRCTVRESATERTTTCTKTR